MDDTVRQQMAYHQQVASYQMANATLQKTRQLVLLYDAVLRFMKQARSAIEEQRYEDRLNLIQKASNIIMGLHGALDYEKGGEISNMLNNFYSAIDLRIISLNRTNSIEECDKIVREIKMMRDAWAQIDEQYTNGTLAPTDPSASKPDNPTGGGSNFSA